VRRESESLLRVRRCCGCWGTRTKERASPGLRLLMYSSAAAACSLHTARGIQSSASQIQPTGPWNVHGGAGRGAGHSTCTNLPRWTTPPGWKAGGAPRAASMSCQGANQPHLAPGLFEAGEALVRLVPRAQGLFIRNGGPCCWRFGDIQVGRSHILR
jgi:hypothetical protein